MADGELVVGAFVGVGKTADAVAGAELGEEVLAAGDDLVGVALVADIPEKFILFEVENIVHRQCQFDDTEIAGEMTAGNGDAIGYKLADFACESFKLSYGEFFQIIWRQYFIQKIRHLYTTHKIKDKRQGIKIQGKKQNINCSVPAI